MTFQLNPKQQEAVRISGGDAMHILLFGGSRSGKTLTHCRTMALRAMKAERTRHVVLRFRFNHVKESVVFDTWPTMMRLCFPEVSGTLNRSDWFYTFPNGSEVWFAGLDDKDRTEKILGKEFATILFNEISQIPWPSVEMAHTRLAQKSALKLRALYDENPPKKGHWSYKLFVQKINPTDRTPVSDPNNYVWLGPMNPEDNKDNLAPEYLSVVRNLSGERRRRFYEGQFGDDTANSLFTDATFDRNRVLGQHDLPEFIRVVVAVDPSGASDSDENQSDAIGIVVVALGSDGKAYLLEDLTIKAGPKTWGGVVASAYERHRADRVVAESNFGGEMVRFVVQAAKPGIPYKEVKASRGKAVRAEPISYLVEDGKVRHVGYFPELEDELTAFTSTGYTGSSSPNRADAYVWALTELFPSIAADRAPAKPIIPKRPQALGQGWMAA